MVGKKFWVNMITATISKEQVTLQAEAQKRSRLGPGSKLEFIITVDERLDVIPV